MSDLNQMELNFGDSFGGGLMGFACFILVVIATVAIVGYIIQYTWNMTLPQIFGIKEITLYQAIGLFILAGLLFRR
jgi:hypothetical protein